MKLWFVGSVKCKWLIVITTKFLTTICFVLQVETVVADSPRENCEQMYPSQSYEADERAQYISECMAATAEEPETEAVDYEGTVEDFVESLPE